MGELRAELRAMSQKMAEKIEDLGQGRGNKKKKDKEIINKSKEVIEQLVSFISIAVRNKRIIYVEYD